MKDVLKKIAKVEGISLKEIEREIALAIKTADRHATPEGEKMWEELSPDGKEVSIEDFIFYLANKVKKC